MNGTTPGNGRCQLGPFCLDLKQRALFRGPDVVPLTPKAFDTLAVLAAEPGRVISKSELMATLWPDTFVEENNLNQSISALRKVLENEITIETVPRRGYRLLIPQAPAKPERLVLNGSPMASEPKRFPKLQPLPVAKPDGPLAGFRRRGQWIAIAGLLLAAGIAVLFVHSKHEPGSAPPRTLRRLTFDEGLQFGPTWSPDGRFIAYSSDRGGKFDIWVQQIGAVAGVRITTRPGHNWQPDWSPDGNQIVFRSEGESGGLFVVPMLGGLETKISSFGYYPKWSPDGSLILFGSTFISGLNKPYVVGLDGQPPREILTEFFKKSKIVERAVGWYPHSRRLSVWGKSVRGENLHRSGFWTVALDGTGAVESRGTAGVAELLSQLATDKRAQFQWGPSERTIYFEGERDGVKNVWKLAVDPSIRFADFERLTTGPGPDTDIAISTDGGRLAYAARSERIRIWSYPFDAASGRLLGKGKPVTPNGFDAWRGDVSPDGKKLTYLVHHAGENELWQTSLPDESTTLVTRGPNGVSEASWSRDSERLGYGPIPGHPEGLVLIPQGGGSAEPLTSALFEGDVVDWSPDGQWIVAEQAVHQPGGVQVRVVLLPLSAAPKAETQARLVTSSQIVAGASEGIFEVRMSPNGRWIVFEAVKGGMATEGAANATLCVVPVSGGPWIRITDGQFWDDKPRWSPDGRTIFFISQRTGFLNVWGIHFDPEQGRPQGQPFRVTSFESPRLMLADNLDWVSMSLTEHQLVLSMKETSGSIWTLHDIDK